MSLQVFLQSSFYQLANKNQIPYLVLNKYENVFSGNVENQINMYSRQAMIIGMNLKAAEPKRNFDVNI